MTGFRGATLFPRPLANPPPGDTMAGTLGPPFGCNPMFLSRLFPFLQPSAADTVAERTRRRVTLHLIPFLFFLYVLAYLDRVNVSVAQFGMEEPVADGGLGLDRETIGF